MNFKINIPIKPVAQARPRFAVRKVGLRNIVCAYDTKKCKEYKEIIAWHALQVWKNSPLYGPIKMVVVFQMGKNGKEVYYTKKPDLDNLAKAIKDALRGIVYHDDSQIVEAHLYKRYGELSIKIEVKEVI